jgi:hypothetical protein
MSHQSRKTLEIGYGLTIIPHRKPAENGPADGHIDGTHTAVSHEELAKSDVVAAKLDIEGLGGGSGQGSSRPGHTLIDAGMVIIVNGAIASQLAVAKSVYGHVLFADKKSVAEAVGDGLKVRV